MSFMKTNWIRALVKGELLTWLILGIITLLIYLTTALF